ncbi:MAG: hypothetical protein NTV91_08115, partial [Proteobacteria bacterium]|nr:hypothetical protein [Pseudomonadota bacterium]
MPNITDTFTEDPNAAYAVAGLIIFVTILLWFVWVSPALSSLRWHFHNLIGSLRDADNDWSRAIEFVEASDTSIATVDAAWRETQRRVVSIPRADVSEFRLLNAPTDLWSPTRLLAQRVNLPLAEAVPNLLVGVGLLFTFAFLTLAIHHAAQVINVPGATAAANTDFVQ